MLKRVRDPRAGDELEVAERLRWLLRLRWVIVPVFVAVGIASDLLMLRHAPWASLAVGGALLAANAVYAAALAREAFAPALVALARVESAFVVALPVIVVALGGDPANPLRYAVLVGVVGAAVVLPRTSDVAATGMWALAALVAGDAAAAGFDPARVDPAAVARWATEGAVVGTVATIAGYLHARREDAAERLRDARARLEGGEAQWASAFDALQEMVVVTGPDGAVVRANRAFAGLLGARPHELVGRPLPAILEGHPPRWWSEPADGVVEIDDPVLDTVVEVTTLRRGDHVVRVARDVGEARALYARLVQADKLAAVGALAAGLAHEVNNPTAFVTSNVTELGRYCAAYEDALRELGALAAQGAGRDAAEAVLARPELAVARREAATAIAESLQGMERIGQVVANLRSVARRDLAVDGAAPVDLADLVQAVARTAAADLRSAAARVEADGPLWVLGRRGELVDVLLNLVVNAVHAREEGRPNRIRIALSREDGLAVVRVSDTGRGTSPAHMKRLFEPSFTTGGASEGGAVGLALARRIVLAHGGSLDVASEPGRGSTFTIRLPAMEAGAFDLAALRGRSGAA